jgi:acyl-CoA synthetase (AMP-forming)/AMP-acid ligase II
MPLVPLASSPPPVLEPGGSPPARPPLTPPTPHVLSFRRIMVGGAPVSDHQLRTWIKAFPGALIVVGFGSSEAEPVAHILAQERLAVKSDVRPVASGFCVGRVVEACRSKVIRIEKGVVEVAPGGWPGWEVKQGEIGELIIAGGHVVRDYYKNPKAVKDNKVIDPDGETVWHRMGDTGYFDGSGRFWITGRVHSTITRSGEYIHPQLVEQAAFGGDARILRLAAAGVKDEKAGQVLVVVLETRDASVVTEAKARLEAVGMRADHIFVTKQPLPVDPRHNSKIQYEKVSAWATEVVAAQAKNASVSPDSFKMPVKS